MATSSARPAFSGLGELGAGRFAVVLFALLDAGAGVAVGSEGGEDVGGAQGVVDGDLGFAEQGVDALVFEHGR